MTVRNQLQFISGFYENWDRSHATRLLNDFGIDPEQSVWELSRNNSRKLALVAACGHHPSVLFLDEAVTGVDFVTAREILTFVKSLAREQGVGVILSSPEPAGLEEFADRIVNLKKGRAFNNDVPTV